MKTQEENHESNLQRVGDPAVEVVLRRILERIEEIERNMRSAFVGGDYDGHRRAHEQFIADLQARRELRKAVTEQVVKGSVWAALIFLGTAAWNYFRAKLGMMQ